MFTWLAGLSAAPRRCFTSETVPAQGLNLQNQRVLICGASGAIGEAIALGFARAGAHPTLHYRTGKARAHRLGERIAAEAGIEISCLGADLARREEAEGLLARAWEILGRVDTLVLSVGNAKDKPIFLVTEQDLEAMLTANLAPAVYAAEAFRARRSGLRGGRIIIVSSITGLVGQPMRAVYAAAKGAVIGYAKSLAREVAEAGMTVNCVAPQVLDSGLARLMKPRMRQLLLANTPVARPCAPEDVAGSVLFLASPAAGYITGTVLNVSGGLVTW